MCAEPMHGLESPRMHNRDEDERSCHRADGCKAVESRHSTSVDLSGCCST